MAKTVGALWLREYEKDGKRRKMMAGELDLGALGTVKIAVFKNEKKEKENQPDYRIVLSEPNDSTGNASNGNGNNDEDMPF
ncbi:hypothetical protein [Hippea maritima]|uniref:Uncharacterized protein n=1 Tax=Hippea maritima (strain ATCC 700847 / DSM 10411 / MH2) TaxID=760142 RepID=F2LV62_HIPMA|nr:hypothetical protein [Hippea maritima]AEA33646.1 hypothetical protein Hipma_0676 [Hippea maritima DSM 10411]